jgi:signal transduction histidine kinase
MVSHEFRTPLSVITLSCHMLEDYRDRLSPEQNLRKLHEILEQTHQMTELLEDVLTLGKARSGTPELSTVSLDLEALCRNLVEQLRLTDTVAHTITFISEGQFHNIWMDEKLIRHILVNLLSNAIKYSPNGGEVRLELCQQGNEVVFRIQDEGIGIPDEDQKRLFEPFHRASNTSNISGTGLGLAIVKENVDKCAGTITVESEEGRGTTFVIRLPLCN